MMRAPDKEWPDVVGVEPDSTLIPGSKQYLQNRIGELYAENVRQELSLCFYRAGFYIVSYLLILTLVVIAAAFIVQP